VIPVSIAPVTPAPKTTPLVSASQITLFLECPRKWAWRYLVKIDTPQSAAAALGDEVDQQQLQPYLTEGRPFDYTKESGYIAASGLEYLPKPGTPGLEVQKYFSMPSATARNADCSARFGYQGFLDLWLPKGGAPLIEPVIKDRYPVVGDFKTTKDLRWAKTGAQLAKDVQAQLYATWAMYETGARVVDLVWIYFQTKGTRRSKRTHLRVTADHVVEQFTRIDTAAVEMFDVRKASEASADVSQFPLSLTPNVEMCEQYGGCPYRHLCNLSPDQVADSYAAKDAAWLSQKRNEETLMSTANLFAKLAAKKAAGETAAATAAPLPPPPASPAASATAPELPAWATAPVDPLHAKKPLGINPPESKLAPAPVTGEAAAAATQPTAPPPAPAAPAEAPKARRGRPPKAKPDPLGADAAAHAGLDAPTPGQTYAPAPADAKDVAAAFAEVAVLDCPETVTVTWGEEAFSPVQYQSFRVGPFSMTGKVRPGESATDASKRLYTELNTFAIETRAQKAQSFLAALGK
jgi:hypothetical protein